MEQYIPKSALVAEINDWQHKIMMGVATIPLRGHQRADATFEYEILGKIKDFLDTFEVKDPYEQCIQYASIEGGIKAHAEDYSFNIESELFNQLTKEQQSLWRKEIEQACISGGYAGVEFARDLRYKENLEVKEVDLEKAIDNYIYTNNGRQRMALELDWKQCNITFNSGKLIDFAKYLFELGLKAQKGEET